MVSHSVRNHRRSIGWVLVLCAVAAGPAWAQEHEHPWNLESLAQPPQVYPASSPEAPGVRGLFYQSLPWKGRQTRVFAWYGVPAERKPGEKFPAMILAHGGGGTAFDDWVRAWNQRGYAAIAMDLEGKLPVGAFPNRQGHSWSGPMRPGAFNDLDDPVEDQWYYHAVADIVLAHSLLRSFPEIDADRIGLTGISWGGVLTCTVAGIDRRLKLAIPVYGCGFLTDSPVFQPRWKALGLKAQDKWMSLWDPAGYLRSATMPMLWVNGANDRHFPLNIFCRSQDLPRGPGTLCLRVGMSHGHKPGWSVEEVYAFADSVLRDGKPLARIKEQGHDAAHCWITFDAPRRIKRAQLVHADDVTDWVQAPWSSSEATLHPLGDRAEASLPARCRAYFFNLTDERGLLVSSPVTTLEHHAPASQTSSQPASASVAPPSHYPDFSWDRVPIAAHLGKPAGPFTEREARFIADHFPLVTVEKTQCMNLPSRGERAMGQAAQQIRKANPRTKILFYWNAFLAYPMYDAHQTFIAHPDWRLMDHDAKPVLVRGRVPTYDLSIPEVRDWWSTVACQSVRDQAFDGLFVDALPKIGMLAEDNRRKWGAAKYEAVEAGLHEMLAMTRKCLGPDGLLIYNGLRGDREKWQDGGLRYLASADGAMVEHFGHYSGRDAQGRIRAGQLEMDIELIRQAGLAGKLVIVKGWPKLSAEPATGASEATKSTAHADITFPLAAFLVAAEKYAYFAYSWGYTDTDGWFETYAEFDRPLGPPKGPAVRDGWEYRREFEHASVWVDIQQERARITWR